MILIEFFLIVFHGILTELVAMVTGFLLLLLLFFYAYNLIQSTFEEKSHE